MSVDLQPILTHQLYGKVTHRYNLKSLGAPPSLSPKVGHIILQILTRIGSNFSANQHTRKYKSHKVEKRDFTQHFKNTGPKIKNKRLWSFRIFHTTLVFYNSLFRQLAAYITFAPLSKSRLQHGLKNIREFNEMTALLLTSAGQTKTYSLYVSQIFLPLDHIAFLYEF